MWRGLQSAYLSLRVFFWLQRSSIPVTEKPATWQEALAQHGNCLMLQSGPQVAILPSYYYCMPSTYDGRS
jgi:hypothetical protein